MRVLQSLTASILISIMSRPRIVCWGSGESGKLLLCLAIARHTFGAGAGTRRTAPFHDELVGGAATVSASCTGSETCEEWAVGWSWTHNLTGSSWKPHMRPRSESRWRSRSEVSPNVLVNGPSGNTRGQFGCGYVMHSAVVPLLYPVLQSPSLVSDGFAMFYFRAACASIGASAQRRLERDSDEMLARRSSALARPTAIGRRRRGALTRRSQSKAHGLVCGRTCTRDSTH